ASRTRQAVMGSDAPRDTRTIVYLHPADFHLGLQHTKVMLQVYMRNICTLYELPREPAAGDIAPIGGHLPKASPKFGFWGLYGLCTILSATSRHDKKSRGEG